jgi:hypothetical protein
MKINQLLDSIRYGEQVVEEMTDKDHIISCLDEDTNQFLASKRLNDFIVILKEDVKDSPVISRMEKVRDKFIEVEERIADGKSFSPAYSRMKFDSINEDYNKIIDSLSDRKTYKQFDTHKLSKVLSTIQYGVKDLDSRSMKETNNALLNTFINEDVQFIENILE